MRHILLLLASALPLVASGTVNCTGTPSTDAPALQTAFTSGGIVTIVGACNVGSTQINAVANMTIQGSGSNGNMTFHGANTNTSVTYTGSNVYVFIEPGNDLTLNGITFIGGGLEFSATVSGGHNIQRNTWNNMNNLATVGNASAIFIDGIMGRDGTNGLVGTNSLIANNDFFNIWQGGYPSASTCPGTPPDQHSCIPGTGIWFYNGILYTTVTGNFMSEMGFNGIKVYGDALYTSVYDHLAAGMLITDNDIQLYHRIGIEIQGCGRGGCDGSKIPWVSPTVTGNNIWNPPTFTNGNGTWPSSLLVGGTTPVVANNSLVNNVAFTSCYDHAYGIEYGGQNGGIIQGNVVSAITTACGSAGTQVYGSNSQISWSFSAGTQTYNNNITCGPGGTDSYQDNGSSGTQVDFHNYGALVCDNNSSLSTSNIVPAITSFSFSGTTVSQALTIKSTLAIRRVQWNFDGGSVISTQQLSTPSTTFDTDQKWVYSLSSFSTSGLSPGTHMLNAVATDTNGNTSTSPSSFTITGGPGTCTPLNKAAGGGNNTAVTNGIDLIDWGSVRIQWTVDITMVAHRIIYCPGSSSSCLTTGTPGMPGGPLVQGMQAQTLGSTNIIGQSIQSPIQPSTQYQVLGQSSATGSSGPWCAGTPETFTTLAKPANTPDPTAPDQVTGITSIPPIPAIGGTNRVMGVSPCTPDNAVGLQTCLNLSVPGDAIGYNPATLYKPASGYFYTPDNPNALQITQANINVGASTFTLSSGTLTNGTQVRFGVNGLSGNGLPNPVIAGFTYTVVNSSGSPSTFQINDGTNTVALVSNTAYGYISVIHWPISQPWIVLYSTASYLPPTTLDSKGGGVLLDPVAYAGSLPTLSIANVGFQWGALAAYYWFQNPRIVTAPVATAAMTDPPSYNSIFNTGPQNDHIIFNQYQISAAGPVNANPTNDRSLTGVNADGSNIAFMNGTATGADYWRLSRLIPAATWTPGGTTLAIPAGSYYWVNHSGTASSCTNASPQTLTLTGSGSGTGLVYYTTSSGTCGSLSAQLQTGVTATGSGFSISSASSPAYPNDGGTLCSGGTPCGTGLPLGVLTVSGGTISNFVDDVGSTTQGASESGLGMFHVGNARGPGPLLLVNNRISGTGVVGVYMGDDGENPCGNPSAPPYCPMLYSQGNLTMIRDYIQPSIKYFQYLPNGGGTNPAWIGTYPYFRNGPELKQCYKCSMDGLFIGPIATGTADGGCLGVVNFTSEFPFSSGLVNYIQTSDIKISNTTCFETGQGPGVEGNPNSVSPGQTIKRTKLTNILLWNDNAWTLYGPAPHPLAQGTIFHGEAYQHGQGQDMVAEHITASGAGGSQPEAMFYYLALSSGDVVRNNFLELITDNGFQGSSFSDYGNNYGAPSTSSLPVPTSPAVGTNLIAAMTSPTWLSNVMLGTYSNSNIYSGGPVEMTPSAISTIAALYPSTPGTYFPSGSTLANRLTTISWLNPSIGDFRLRYNSPYAAANHLSTDGKDIGVLMDELQAAQGLVQNVHTYSTSTTATTIAWLAPDSFACTVDWDYTSNFITGIGTITPPHRVTPTIGVTPRSQYVNLTGITADALINYRVNCSVFQPTGTVQLP